MPLWNSNVSLVARIATLALSVALVACGSEAGVPSGGGEVIPRESQSATEPAVSTVDWTQTTAPEAAPPIGEPFKAPNEKWTWVDVEGAKCMDGSSSGVGVNLSKDSNDVVIFLEGGGACWDASTCWGAVPMAFYRRGYDDLMFKLDPQRILYVLDRKAEENPFRSMNMIYVPYCTGDAFSGNNVTKMSVLGKEHETHFVGSKNFGLILSRIMGTLPAAKRVWLVGDSAGGFGAAFNFARVAAAYPQAQVGALDDSGPPVNPDPERWGKWKKAWNMQLPTDCPGCQDGPRAFLEYYRVKYPGSRFGVISYEYDVVIAPFMNLSFDNFHDQLFSAMDQVDGKWPNGHYYLVGGASHVALLLPSNEMKSWIWRMVTSDPTWSSRRP